MIYIYGDSHADFTFRNIKVPHRNYFCTSITMHRIGRDNTIVNFNREDHDEDSIICFLYGEVDCRCHIAQQIHRGRNEDDIILTLVDTYLNTIYNNVKVYNSILVFAVVPPTQQTQYEQINGPIQHEFPFVGTDEDRVRFTKKMNTLLEIKCSEYKYIFINPYESYTMENGCLRHELSDGSVHISKNEEIHNIFYEVIEKIWRKSISAINIG